MGRLGVFIKSTQVIAWRDMNWEARETSLNQSKLRSLWASRVFRLVLVLAIGKVVVILAVFLFENPASVLQGMGTKWDSNYYEIIATQGYGPSAPYVFSPVYPAIIKLVYSFVGNAWVSGLLVTNSLSFVFPLLLYEAFGYRTALFAELFPTYLVFTTVAYSDVIALVFLASSLLLLMRDSIIKSSIGLSGAVLTFFNLAWTLPSFFFALLVKWRLRNLLFYTLPLVTGGLILLWFKVATGSRVRKPFGAGLLLAMSWRTGLIHLPTLGGFWDSSDTDLLAGQEPAVRSVLLARGILSFEDGDQVQGISLCILSVSDRAAIVLRWVSRTFHPKIVIARLPCLCRILDAAEGEAI
jgi:hypothetical protein